LIDKLRIKLLKESQNWCPKCIDW